MSQESKNQFQPQGRVKVIQGSILMPHDAGLRFILNINNMVGKAENPLYPIFDKKWPRVKQDAKGWYNTRTGAYKKGALNTSCVQSDVWIIHCLVQDEELKTDLAAFETCLKEVCKMAKYEKASLHISTLLVEAVPELQELVQKHITSNGINVSYYEEQNK